MLIRRQQIKKELIDILRQKEIERIFAAVDDYNGSDLLNPLFSTLYHIEEIVRWHAVSAFGFLVDTIARRDMESARRVMRRFLWSLNDESGGIGWGAPEAMAEIMAQNKELFKEYHHMLLSYTRSDGPERFQDGNFLELPQMQRGVVWGIGRLARIYRETLVEQGVAADILPYLLSPDDGVRGMAVWALGGLRVLSAKSALQACLMDHASVGLYRDGDIVETKVSELACQALGAMD